MSAGGRVSVISPMLAEVLSNTLEFSPFLSLISSFFSFFRLAPLFLNWFYIVDTFFEDQVSALQAGSSSQVARVNHI